MRELKKRFFDLIDSLREFLWVAHLAIPEFPVRRRKLTVPVIASVTSYPPRIDKSWLAIETLLRQSVQPEKLILVLNEEEFPDRNLPGKIRRQVRRGLHILWVERNGKSYDKLLPARREFPGRTIVTFDDDKFFPKTLLNSLYQASLSHPGAVIGSRGWIISDASDGLHYGTNWRRARPGETGRNLMTPGGNGCLYPQASLDPIVDNLEKALQTCPTADDIWFWGSIQKADSIIFCLGMPPHRPVKALSSGVALSKANETMNDVQFQKVMDTFGIREKFENSIRDVR